MHPIQYVALATVQKPLVALMKMFPFTMAIVRSGKAPMPRWKPGQLAFASMMQFNARITKECTWTSFLPHASVRRDFNFASVRVAAQ